MNRVVVCFASPVMHEGKIKCFPFWPRARVGREGLVGGQGRVTNRQGPGVPAKPWATPQSRRNYLFSPQERFPPLLRRWLSSRSRATKGSATGFREYE